MISITGIDGCPTGWLYVSKQLASGQVVARILPRIDELSQMLPKPAVVTIDIPIGLTDTGPRDCDLEARRLLGKPRSNSVFPAPVRPILVATTYNEACEIGESVDGRRLSRQAWGIVPKIQEVDTFLRSDSALQGWIREVHPEVCFWCWNGSRAMAHSKKNKPGRAERERLVVAYFGEAYREARSSLPKGKFAPDDLLDAFAALWTAERITKGGPLVTPPNPGVDRFGLRMEIVA
jgi:predicted RNase H-like nuclease